MLTVIVFFGVYILLVWAKWQSLSKDDVSRDKYIKSGSIFWVDGKGNMYSTKTNKRVIYSSYKRSDGVVVEKLIEIKTCRCIEAYEKGTRRWLPEELG